MSPTWVYAQMDTSDRGLSHPLRSRGGCEGFDRKKNVLVTYLTLLTVAKYARVFQCPPHIEIYGIEVG